MLKNTLIFLCLVASSLAFAASQQDFGAGTNTNYTIPSDATRCQFWINGPGGGGGAGNANSAGGGGGAGAKGMFDVRGSIGGQTVQIITPAGGTAGIAPGGNGGAGGGATHTRIIWSNGFEMIAGAAQGGYGGNGQPGPGGVGGNIATNTVDQGGNAVWPPEITSKGQFNLGGAFGQNGSTRFYGRGGNEGDVGSGGRGGWWNQSGLAGQGGYVHIECE